MTIEQELIQKFTEIRDRGWIETYRHGDQCLGNTFEDLIGKKEDNKQMADFHDIELKSHRTVTKSMITLFSKKPSYPRGASNYLRQNYGVFDTEYNEKILNTTLGGLKENTHRGGYSFKAVVDREAQRVYLQIRNMETGELVNDEIYWSFSVLNAALEKKLKKIAILYGEEDVVNGQRRVRYTSMKLIEGLTFEKLLSSIENGKLFIDIRIGVYASGKNEGKTHDHGTAFRIHLNDLLSAYGTVREF